LLRSEFGLAAEQVNAMSDEAAAEAIEIMVVRRELKAAHREMLDRLVAEGTISRARAEEMTYEEAKTLHKSQMYLEQFDRQQHASRAGLVAPKPSKTSVRAPEPSASQIVATLADLVAIVAAQQEEIAQLRDQVAHLHHSNMAMFGKQAIIEQLSSVERDFKGFEAKVELEESSDRQDEGRARQESTSHSTYGDSRDTRAAIEGLASRIAGLNASRTVDLAEMNLKVVRLSEIAKRRATVSTRGTVYIKIDEVRRSRDPDRGSGT
jgi:uncharacterized coiled-coil protein SlyX